MVTNVTKTVLKRQATKLLGQIAEKTDSKVLTMAFNYLIGPQGQKLNKLMETSQEILKTVKTMEADLKDLSHDVNAGIGELKDMFLQGDVEKQYQQVTQIYDQYAMIWSKYRSLLDFLNSIEGEPTDAQVAELENMVAQIRILYDLDTMRIDIVSAMGYLSDQPLTDQLSPVITHDPNDPTYVKAVREKSFSTLPFQHQIVLKTEEAANTIITPLIELMTLYGDFVYLEYDIISNDSNATHAQLTDAQAQIDLYHSYYNMMINVIDNVCDQANTIGMMRPEDVNIKVYLEPSDPQPIDAYRVILNDTGYEVIIAADARNMTDAVSYSENDNTYYAHGLANAMEITSPTHRKFVVPHNREEYKKIFSTMYKENADCHPETFFSNIGCLGAYVNENDEIVSKYEHADYFLINNLEEDRSYLTFKSSNYNFSLLDATYFDASTNEDNSFETDSQDVSNGDYNGTYLIVWVDEENLTAANADHEVVVWSTNTDSPCKVSFASAGNTDWRTEMRKFPAGSNIDIRIELSDNYRLKSLYYLGLVNSAGTPSGLRQDIITDGDYLAHEDVIECSVYLPRQDIQLFVEIDDINTYSVTVSATGGATVSCDLTQQIVGEQVDFSTTVPYGSDVKTELLGLTTKSTYPVMSGTFEMPPEPCSLTVSASVAVPTGEGTEKDPIVIKTRGELEYLSMPENSELWSKNIRLGADIVLYGRDWLPIGTEETPFTGTFDGNGYIIEGITVTDKDGGMFGVNSGTVVNLQLVDPTVDSDAAIGIVAKTNNGTIANSIVSKGIVRGSSIGGIVGQNNGTVVKCCTAGVYGLSAGNGITATEQKLKYCYTDNAGETNGTYVSREKILETGFPSMVNHITGLDDYGFYWTVDVDSLNAYPTLTSDPEEKNLYGFWSTDGAYGNIICTPHMAKPGETVTFEPIDRSVLKGDQFDTNITGVKAYDDMGNLIELVTDTSFVMPDSNVTFAVEFTSLEYRFDGLGTQESPWLIQNTDDLRYMSRLLECEYGTYSNGYYRMTADIDMSAVTDFKPIGSDTIPFAGTFNGNGYIIKNLTVENKNGGLFGVNNGLLVNIQLHNAAVTSDTAVGFIAKTNNRAIANSIIVGGRASGNVGGIAGTSNGYMSRCCTIYTDGISQGKGLLAEPDEMLFLCFTDIEGEKNGEYMTRDQMTESGFVAVFNHLSNTKTYGFYWTLNTSGDSIYPQLTSDPAYAALYGFYNTFGEFGKLICSPLLAKPGETVNITINERSADAGDEYDAYVTDIKAIYYDIDDVAHEVEFTTATSFVMPRANVYFTVEYTLIGSYFKGSGTESDPWIIQSAEELTQLALLCEREYSKYGSAHYRMGADIDMSDVTDFSPIGSEEHPFNGEFDGNGYVISSLVFVGDEYAGIFGYTDKDAYIHHLGLEDIYFTTSSTSISLIGGVAAVTNESKIDSCYFDGVIVSPITDSAGMSVIGGIVGQMYEATVSNCYNIGTVSGPVAGHLFMQLGGIVGGVNGFVFSRDRIVNCYNAGTVNITKNFGKRSDGAIIGFAPSNGVKNCYFDKSASVTSQAYFDMLTAAASQTGSRSTSEMKVLADTLGDAFINAPTDVNNGYPVLAGVGVGRTYRVSLSYPKSITLKIGAEENSEKLFNIFRGQKFTFEIIPEEYVSRITVLVNGVPLKQALKTYTVEDIIGNTHIELVLDHGAEANPPTGDASASVALMLIVSAAVITVCVRKKRYCR